MDAPTRAGGGQAGGQALRLASGSLLQQVAQVTGLVAMFAIVTVLARRLPVAELGVYGLLTSLAGYLLVVQNAGAGAAVRAMAAASSDSDRRAAFSTTLALYLAAGVLAGLVVAGLGVVLSSTVGLPADAERQARLGSLLLGAVTALGWPLTAWRDALRAHGLFSRAAVTEIAALAAYVALVLALVYAGAGLSVVIGASGSLPLLVGAASAIVARSARVPFGFSRGGVSRDRTRELLGVAGYLSLTEAAAAAIYTVNRALLGLLGSARLVGLYEGPVRAHNLVRALNAAVTVTVLPTASRYQASGDRRRLRELLVRGTRYTLGLTVPLAVVGMVLAAPILDFWLGPRYREAGTAMAILMSHWLVNGSSGLLMALLVGVGRARQVTGYAAAVAVGDVVLALALIPWLGLEGVAIATALPYLLAFPVLLRMALQASGVGVGELVRQAFVPSLALGAALAALLGALRLVVDIEGAPAVVAAALGGLALYWVAFYALWLRPDERGLVRQVARGLAG